MPFVTEERRTQRKGKHLWMGLLALPLVLPMLVVGVTIVRPLHFVAGAYVFDASCTQWNPDILDRIGFRSGLGEVFPVGGSRLLHYLRAGDWVFIVSWDRLP